MNAHKIKHGDVVVDKVSGTYRMYIQAPNKFDALTCTCLNHNVTYDIEWYVESPLTPNETFLFNIKDTIECVSKQ